MSVDSNLLNQLTGARSVNLDHLHGEPFTGVSIDTRTIRSGELFVAVRGDRFDGHEFLKQAFDSGAAAAVVDANWLAHTRSDVADQPLTGVPDTLRALAELARSHRRSVDIPIIAIAGSNGKTSTKEMVASVLSERWRVLKTEGTLNNHIGVPLTLLRLDPTYQAAVIELGMNHLGEIGALCEIAEPTHGLVTNIMREHLEFLGTLENVARAEGELFDWLAQCDGTVFLNADEPLLVGLAAGVKKKWRYGFGCADADVRGTSAGLAEDGTGRLLVDSASNAAAFEARVGLVGPHHVKNALAAVAIGLYFGVDPERIRAALANQKPAKHRMNVFRAGGITLLDDTYNANPDSMLAALHTLAALPCKGRRIAALGNMGELGPKSVEYHREIGAAVRTAGIHALFTLGDLARSIFDAASSPVGAHCKDREELQDQLKGMFRPGDIVLLKASRSVKLDLVVDELKKMLYPNG